jgi:molybdate transport repressor ModE-like protein
MTVSRSDEQALDVGRLRLLHEVSVRGSIAGAARAVGLTASAVSQQLAALERQAGTALLDRTPHGVELTPAGVVLCRRAEAILAVLVSARADLDRLNGAVHGEVRLATVASAAATVVSDALRTLRSAHPDIGVSVVAAEPSQSIALLHAADVDLAVVDQYDAQPFAVPDQFGAVGLLSEALVVVAPAGALRSGRPVQLADLANRDWVMPPEEAACGAAVRAACRRAGFEPRVRWETDDLLLLERAVAAGHGIAVLPPLAVTGSAGIEAHPLAEPGIRRTLQALSRPGAAQRPAVCAVIDALAAHVRPVTA